MRFLAALLVAFPVWAQVAVPPLKGRVTDLTGTLKPEQIASLEQMLQSFEARKGSQITVLMLPTTQPLDSVETIRAARSSRIMMFPAPPDREDVVKEDHRIPGPATAPDVTVRVYRPKAAASGPRPGVFEIHGGGFMMGDIAMMDPWCQRVAAEVDAVVVSMSGACPVTVIVSASAPTSSAISRVTNCWVLIRTFWFS